MGRPRLIDNFEFKASEFPCPEVWEADEVRVQNCAITVDAPLPSHAEYLHTIFYGWPTFTPDEIPKVFTSNHIILKGEWFTNGENVLSVAGKKISTWGPGTIHVSGG